MEKITFVDNVTKANAETFNTMQDNIDDAINDTIDYIDEKNTYSTDEIRIGTWVDGKPLYRKIYDISSITSSNSNLINISSLNISQINKISGSIKDSYNNIFPIPLYDSSSNYNVLFYNGQYLRGRAVIGTGGSITSAYAIIEYTKTTD